MFQFPILLYKLGPLEIGMYSQMFTGKKYIYAGFLEWKPEYLVKMEASTIFGGKKRMQMNCGLISYNCCVVL